MKTVSAQKLVELVAAIMQGSGSSTAEARAIATRLVDSNLVGHESHGVLRVGKYLEWVRDGTLKPNTAPEIVFDSDTIAIVDGRQGFGQVTGEFATRLGIAKARSKGIAMVGLRNCGHLGRLGDWAELAAEAGQVSLHFLNTSGAQRVAPYGGSDRRLSTNPMAIGVPVAGAPPVILDITTSTVAEGKLMVAMNKGERVPDGWIVDKAGRPTTDPKDFYDGGALLTIGAHKGSGLSILTDLLAGAVTTGRSSDPEDTILRNNMLSIYIDPSVYDTERAVLAEAERFVAWVKASPPARAGEAVLAPGDVERRTRTARQAGGVPLDDKTWQDLVAAARSVGIDEARAAIACVIGGNGPPVLLLHGYPQTHAMWHRVAPVLARTRTVVAADLRGYGDSSKPASDDAHAAYSKRAMAADMVAVMRALGHERFDLVGHDRGGRVAHRMAADHPDAVRRVAVLDIAPTYAMYTKTGLRFAKAYYHWFFLIQPGGMPERLIGGDPDGYLLHKIGSLGSEGTSFFDRRALDEYLRCFRDPATIHATCEDYRASATIDLEHDAEDRAAGRRLRMPVLALWGERNRVTHGIYDTLAEWREVADDVRGGPVASGHYLPEEAPDATLAALQPFLDA